MANEKRPASQLAALGNYTQRVMDTRTTGTQWERAAIYQGPFPYGSDPTWTPPVRRQGPRSDRGHSILEGINGRARRDVNARRLAEAKALPAMTEAEALRLLGHKPKPKVADTPITPDECQWLDTRAIDANKAKLAKLKG